ncbi:MAG: peptide chain release factor N(5)-glutamine methyltransferase [Vulcanimicrobiaceae bacterium]
MLALQQLAKTSDSPRADAFILLSHVLGRDKEWLIAHGESLLTQAQSDRFAAFCEARTNGVPVAYITGFAGFYGREFVVNDAVLVPRPETEHLVEDALVHLRGKPNPVVLDVGVGSGAIGCTIAAEIPDAFVQGTDASEAAIDVAQENARRLNVGARCAFYHADLVKPNDAKQYDAIVANLPYVPSAEIPRKPDPVGYEPAGALDGGPDGLDLYRRLLEHAPRLLRPGGLLLMEAAPPTIDALATLARRALPDATIEVRQDYGGRDRYVWALRHDDDGGHRSG